MTIGLWAGSFLVSLGSIVALLIGLLCNNATAFKVGIVLSIFVFTWKPKETIKEEQ